MELITVLLTLLFAKAFVIQSFPINNGFSIKFQPISPRDEVKHKQFGAIFAKIPQELTSGVNIEKDVVSQPYIPDTPETGAGCTNQIARIIFPMKHFYSDFNETQTWDKSSYINLPLLQQPFRDYKILVATAPQHIKMGGGADAKSMVIYVIFSEDGAGDDPGTINIPKIYFVKDNVRSKLDIGTKDRIDPILVIDSNRTVTGLKSKQVSKFVKFRSKLIDRYTYEITP